MCGQCSVLLQPALSAQELWLQTITTSHFPNAFATAAGGVKLGVVMKGEKGLKDEGFL
jgi:predicted Rdx family selenoprotein